ncbi:MAG: hypothetical protein OHK0039_05500 [Bacteroidia bacterium]
MFFCHLLVFSGLILFQGLFHALCSAGWLSLLLLLIALYISPFMLGYAGWYGLDGYREVLFYLPLQQILLIGPVFWMYLKSLLYHDYTPNHADWLHFLPGMLYLIYSTGIFMFDICIADEVFFYRDGRDKDFDLWYQVAGFLSLGTYFLLSLRQYQQYRQRVFDTLSYAEEVSYTWVHGLLSVFLLMLMLRGVFFVLNPEWDAFGRKFWYYLAISLTGYYLAIQGYRQGILLHTSEVLRQAVSEEAPLQLPLPNPRHEAIAEAGAVDRDYAAWVGRIEQLMQEGQLYKNPVLTLADVAQHLGETTKTISGVINSGTGLNFNDYINRFRVEAFLQEIAAGAHQRHTLLGIAISCGFNSKSTFNRAFKKHTGLSPHEYIQKHMGKGVKS